MGSEILTVPEDNLKEVILVIRNGLKNTPNLPKEVIANLNIWCNEEEEYLNAIGREDQDG